MTCGPNSSDRPLLSVVTLRLELNASTAARCTEEALCAPQERLPRLCATEHAAGTHTAPSTKKKGLPERIEQAARARRNQ